MMMMKTISGVTLGSEMGDDGQLAGFWIIHVVVFREGREPKVLHRLTRSQPINPKALRKQ